MALVFGQDRLPERDQEAPAWPTLSQVNGRREAAFTRWVKGTLKDKAIGQMLAAGKGTITMGGR